MDSQVRRPLPQSEDSFSVCSISSTFIPRSPVAVMHSELHTSDGHMKMLKSSRWSNELPCEFQAASRCCQNGRGSCAVVLLLPARGILIIAEPSVCHLQFGSRSLSNISSFVRLKVPWTLVSKTGPRCCSTTFVWLRNRGAEHLCIAIPFVPSSPSYPSGTKIATLICHYSPIMAYCVVDCLYTSLPFLVGSMDGT